MRECLICKGTGKLELSKQELSNDVLVKKRAIKQLHKNGYGIRQIQRLLNYKSPRSVSKILEEKENVLDDAPIRVKIFGRWYILETKIEGKGEGA